MTHDEAQALAADLERAGVKVEEVRPRKLFGLPGEWEIVAHSEMPAHDYTITNAGIFRKAVREGIIPQLAPDALVAPPALPPTRVVHVRRDPNFDVYIGRPMPRFPELRATGWGNPFRPGKDGDAIARYREWIAGQPQLIARLPELRGKVLGCWCAPKGGLPGNLHGTVCHGEILAALADEMSEDEESEVCGNGQ